MVLAPVSRSCPKLEGRLPTRYSPVRHFTSHPKATFSYDLHVLSTPPAFVLSQNQTLQFKTWPSRSGEPEQPDFLTDNAQANREMDPDEADKEVDLNTVLPSLPNCSA
jgi:hypothetical protein